MTSVNSTTSRSRRRSTAGASSIPPATRAAGSILGVWIDHASARLVRGTDRSAAQCVTIVSHAEGRRRSTGLSGVSLPGHLGGNPSDHDQGRRRRQLQRFYDQVIDAVAGSDPVLILGPAEAKHELVRRMREREDPLRRQIAVETASKMTVRQIAARVRAFTSEASA